MRLFLVGIVLFSFPLFADPADCFEQAISQNIFESYEYENALELCKGDGNVETVECFKAAKQMFKVIPEKKALSLCAGNHGLETIDCYQKAYRQVKDPMKRSRHALLLCGGK